MGEEKEEKESAGEKRRFPELLGETTPSLTLSDDRGAERLSRPGINDTHTRRGGPQGARALDTCA